MYPFQVTPTRPAVSKKLRSQGVSPLLSAVFTARGIENLKDVEDYLYPTSKVTHSPFLFHHMEKATTRIKQGLAKQEKMAIYGDYDVDGITSTSLLTDFLREQGGDVLPYIPERMSEGYGLNEIALEDLFRNGIRLVITVDCGISGVNQVEFANALGMDVIITDHHSCPTRLPPAYAIINPRQGDYPFPSLAGVGVALKLAQALVEPEKWDDVFAKYSDLVAVGTVADVMPMEGENRYFVKEGLKKLNEAPSLSFSTLIGKDETETRCVTAGTIGYSIAPRINAAGRLDKTQVALDLLLTKDQESATTLVEELSALNTQRQAIEGGIYRSCLELYNTKPPEDLVFLWGTDWHPGVVGIVASRLGERFHVPAIMICCRDGVGKGSCRTVGDLNLYEILSSCSDILLGFGGHAQAAGFTIAEEKIEALHARLKDAVKQRRVPNKEQRLTLDARATVEQLTLEEVRALSQFEPCGAGCPRPSFLIERMEVIGVGLVGGGRHLRLRLSQNGKEIGGIFFNFLGDPIYVGAFLDVAFYLQENCYRGVTAAQLRIFAVTLSQENDGFYQRWKRGGQISPQEAIHLCPTLDEFEALLSYLRTIQGDSPFLLKETTLNKLCQRLEEGANLPFSHGEVCLAVLRERGQVEIQTKQGEIALYLRQNVQDAPLEQSPILEYLGQQ